MRDGPDEQYTPAKRLSLLRFPDISTFFLSIKYFVMAG